MSDTIENNNTTQIEQQVETKPFKTFSTQKEFDDYNASLRKSSEERALKSVKIETEDGQTSLAKLKQEWELERQAKEKEFLANQKALWKQEADEFAKMTEAEKTAKQEAEMKETMRQERISFHRDLAQEKLKSAGFSEDEIEMYLDTIVSEDKISTMGKIQRICDGRKSYVEKTIAEVTSKINGGVGGTQTGNANAQNANKLQMDYDNAKKNHNSTLMTSIIRKAKEQKVELKQN